MVLAGDILADRYDPTLSSSRSVCLPGHARIETAVREVGESITEVRQQIVLAMINEDPKLEKWLRAFLKVYKD